MNTSAANKTTRICIPIPRYNRGGMYRFLEYFREWLEKNDIELTDDLNDNYDILFTNSFVIDPKVLRKQKKRNPKLRIIQRMDGSARDYGRYDDADQRQSISGLYADLCIFQSKYSKYATTQKFKVAIRNGPVINNPVDLETFSPGGPKMELPGKIKVCNISFSTNPKKGTWRIGSFAQANPEVDFILCGRYPELPELPNIHLLGCFEKDDLAKAIRSCDVFLFTSENEACANVLTEAMASGLPVLYVDSGGNGELVGDAGTSFTDETFTSSLEHIVQHLEEFSKRARDRAVKHFAPEIIFPQYWEAISNSSRQPLPTIVDIIRLARAGYPVIRYPNVLAVPSYCIDLARHICRKGKAVAFGSKG